MLIELAILLVAGGLVLLIVGVLIARQIYAALKTVNSISCHRVVVDRHPFGS